MARARNLRVAGQALGDALPLGVTERAAQHAAGADGVAFAGDADVDVGLVGGGGGHSFTSSANRSPASRKVVAILSS